MAQTSMLQQGKILIVDDERANIRLLEIILQQAGYANVHSTTDSRQALPLFRNVHPDIVLLDLSMPHLDGLAVMRQLHQEMPDHVVPILVLTADASAAIKYRTFQAGAQDFLTKPFDEAEVLLRIHNLLEIRLQHVVLEELVQQRTRDLANSQLETLQRLARAAEYRDDDTGLHTRRVGRTAARIAASLGLSPAEVELLDCAAPLHDVGKIGVPDSILLKPGKLTADEFAIMQKHTTIGANILSGSSSSWLQMAEEIALAHHERWDGSGYPLKLGGEDIPLMGRIVTVADVFDALTHERPYKRAWSVAEATAEIDAHSSRQFDPRVVQAFLTLPLDRFV